MNVKKSSCVNCVARVYGVDHDVCDYTGDEITDMNYCCDDWEPDDELLAVLQEENADLRNKLAAAELQRDAERAHNAVLRKGLEDIIKEGTTLDDKYGKLYDHLAVMAVETHNKAE